MIVTFFSCYILLLSYSHLPLSLSLPLPPLLVSLSPSAGRNQKSYYDCLTGKQTQRSSAILETTGMYHPSLPPHTHPNTPLSHSHTHTPNTPPSHSHTHTKHPSLPRTHTHQTPLPPHTLTCRLQTDVSPGDVVQVNAPFNAARGCCVIDNGWGSLIVDPDQLISGTTVANSITCVRRCV